MFASRFANVAGVTAKSYARQMSAVRGTPAEMRADTMRWRNISIGKELLHLNFRGLTITVET